MSSLAVNAASTDVSKLPALLSKQQTCTFLGIGSRTLDRRLADGTIYSTKLGRGQSSPVRIPRDRLLRDLGLIEPAEKVARDRRVGDAEWHEVAARLGFDADKAMGASARRQ